MPKMIQTPKGVFFIDDDATPEAIANATADFLKRNSSGGADNANAELATRFAKDRAANVGGSSDPEVQRRAGNLTHGLLGDAAGLLGKVAQGATMNFNDEIQGALSAGTKGVYDAITHGDLSQIPQEYRRARDTTRAVQDANSGALSTTAEIAGALMTPFKVADTLKAARFAPLVKAGTRLEEAPAVVQGIAEGAGQGALNGAGADNSGDLMHTLYSAGDGALVGGAAGGLFGGAVTGLRRGAQIIADRYPGAANRVAYDRIAMMLRNAKMSPQDAESELAATKAAGQDGMVMDLSPGLRGQAANLARRPELPASNDIVQRGQTRIDARGDGFENEVRKYAPDTLSNNTADEHIANVNAARKGQGGADYPSVLNKNFVWNDHLEDFVQNAPPITRKAMASAVDLVRNERKDPTVLGISFDADGNIVFQKTPSMQVFDYMKRAFNQNIAQAYKAGDDNSARILSGELDRLKDGISRSNPEYADVLAKQRDYYQRMNSTQQGIDWLKQLTKRDGPQAILQQIKTMDPALHDDARTGIMDAIIALRGQQADPASYFAKYMRSPEQRKVMEFAFDGKGNLGRFTKWLEREYRAKQTNDSIVPTRQSITSTVQNAGASLDHSPGGLATAIGRGYAYGGPAGASAAGLRWFNDLKNGMSPHALDAMAKILMGDGKGLPEGVSQADAFRAVRKAQNAKWATQVAKGAQQPYTDYTGN